MTNSSEPDSVPHEEAPRSGWVYIVGQGRSGSTLLGNMLADAVSGFNCGELEGLWSGLSRERLCTCGVSLSKCEIWSSVVDIVCMELGFTLAEEAIAASRRRTRQRQLLFTARLPKPTDEEQALRAATERAVEEVSGARTLIDSSKIPPMLWTAAQDDRPLTAVHLIRDPRGTAHSWAKLTPDPSQRSGYMKRQNVVKSSIDWVVINLTSLRVMKNLPHAETVEMRYEDLVQDLSHELQRVVDPSTAAPVPTAALTREAEPTGENGHAIAGNPRRFQREAVRPDTRWHSAMPSRDRLISSIVTTPLRPRFGYPARPTRHHGADES